MYVKSVAKSKVQLNGPFYEIYYYISLTLSETFSKTFLKTFSKKFLKTFSKTFLKTFSNTLRKISRKLPENSFVNFFENHVPYESPVRVQVPEFGSHIRDLFRSRFPSTGPGSQVHVQIPTVGPILVTCTVCQKSI